MVKAGWEPLFPRKIEEKTISSFFANLLGQVIVGAIISVGLIAVFYTLTKQWPDPYILAAASIGTAMSPFFWRTVRWAQGIPVDENGIPIDNKEFPMRTNAAPMKDNAEDPVSVDS